MAFEGSFAGYGGGDGGYGASIAGQGNYGGGFSRSETGVGYDDYIPSRYVREPSWRDLFRNELKGSLSEVPPEAKENLSKVLEVISLLPSPLRSVFGMANGAIRIAGLGLDAVNLVTNALTGKGLTLRPNVVTGQTEITSIGTMPKEQAENITKQVLSSGPVQAGVEGVNPEVLSKIEPMLQDTQAPDAALGPGYDYERAIVDYGRTKGMSRYDALQNKDELIAEMRNAKEKGMANPYTEMLSQSPLQGVYDNSVNKPLSGTEAKSSYYWENPDELAKLQGVRPVSPDIVGGSNITGTGLPVVPGATGGNMATTTPKTAQDIFNDMVDNFYGVGGKSYKTMLDEDAAYQNKAVQGSRMNISAGGKPFFNFIPKQAYAEAEFTSPNRSGLSYQSALQNLYKLANTNDPYVKPDSQKLADTLSILGAGSGLLRNIYPYLKSNSGQTTDTEGIDSSLSGDASSSYSDNHMDAGTSDAIFETDDSWKDWDLY